MYIKNLEDHDIPFKYNGKQHRFPANSLIYIDEKDIPYEVLKSAYGSHILDLIEDKYVEVNVDCIGSNFDDFLEEEGILEEVEALAKEKVEQFINNIEETIKEKEDGTEQKETSKTTTSEATTTKTSKTATSKKDKEEKIGSKSPANKKGKSKR
jgi:hypothetical protein